MRQLRRARSRRSWMLASGSRSRRRPDRWAARRAARQSLHERGSSLLQSWKTCSSALPLIFRVSLPMSQDTSVLMSRLCYNPCTLSVHFGGRSGWIPERRKIVDDQRPARREEGLGIVHARKDQALPDAQPLRRDHAVRLPGSRLPAVRQHPSGHGRGWCSADRPDEGVLGSGRPGLLADNAGDLGRDVWYPHRCEGGGGRWNRPGHLGRVAVDLCQ